MKVTRCRAADLLSPITELCVGHTWSHTATNAHTPRFVWTLTHSSLLTLQFVVSKHTWIQWSPFCVRKACNWEINTILRGNENVLLFCSTHTNCKAAVKNWAFLPTSFWFCRNSYCLYLSFLIQWMKLRHLFMITAFCWAFGFWAPSQTCLQLPELCSHLDFMLCQQQPFVKAKTRTRSVTYLAFNWKNLWVYDCFGLGTEGNRETTKGNQKCRVTTQLLRLSLLQ